MARATDLFGRHEDPDGKVKEVKAWLKAKGVRDFEPVSLFCDHLSKVCLVHRSCRSIAHRSSVGYRYRD